MDAGRSHVSGGQPGNFHSCLSKGRFGCLGDGLQRLSRSGCEAHRGAWSVTGCAPMVTRPWEPLSWRTLGFLRALCAGL